MKRFVLTTLLACAASGMAATGALAGDGEDQQITAPGLTHSDPAALDPPLLPDEQFAALWLEDFPLEYDDYLLSALSTPADIDIDVVPGSRADAVFRPATLQDTAPLQALPTTPDNMLTASPTASQAALDDVFRGGPRSNLQPTVSNVSRTIPARTVAADRILGIESRPRSTSDLGSLLGRSNQTRGVATQKRNPIITDPRIRGSRVGSLAASGSYWVPARIDLDTMVSKIDSRLIDDVVVVKGPYSGQYGPGYDFIDFQMLASPRNDDGLLPGGQSSIDYQSNGDQLAARQTFSLAEEDWGARVSYGHRTGSDYESGDGIGVPSSYKSRDVNVALGYDVSSDQTLELNYLRLDQTDVELPGQAFDIDVLVTNGVSARWYDRGVSWADRLELSTWYNDTDLKGNAQNPAKRRTFPFLDIIRFTGVTDVTSVSTGAKSAAVWEHDEDSRTTAGVDVRIVRQELNEITSSPVGIGAFTNANSPIPRSASVNPGLFLEHTTSPIDGLDLTAGVRGDVVKSEILDDTNRLQNVGTGGTTLANIYGTDDFDKTFGLWSAYLNGSYELDDQWTLRAGAGHGMRPPSLTEMYVAESFMFLLQSGLNTVTGDPRLDPERRTQLDLGVDYVNDRFSMRASAYHAWVRNYITFENMSVRRGPPFNQVEQVNLKYVNTDLATLLGFEADAEYRLLDELSLFGSTSYVRGTDRSRNGSFATFQSQSSPTVIGSERIQGLPRGQFSGTTGPENEALPGITPLEARLGVRLNGDVSDVKWNVELSARIVDDQDRVAQSLFETRTPGFTVYDLRTYWRFTENLTAVAGIENFTDKEYREHFDFRSITGQSIRQPGANYYVGSELTW